MSEPKIVEKPRHIKHQEMASATIAAMLGNKDIEIANLRAEVALLKDELADKGDAAE